MFNHRHREEFSPWDDEPINILHFNRQQSPNNCTQKRFRTVAKADAHRSQSNITPLRSPRTIMSISKVNFCTLDSELARAIPSRQQSKGKFEGPRLTFYLKMNPSQSKSFQKIRDSRSPSCQPEKQGQRESLVSTNTSSHPETKQEPKVLPFTKSSANLYSIRKMRDDHRTMRKLKAVQLSRAFRGK